MSHDKDVTKDKKETKERGNAVPVRDKGKVKKSDSFFYFGRSIMENWDYNDLKKKVKRS